MTTASLSSLCTRPTNISSTASNLDWRTSLVTLVALFVPLLLALTRQIRMQERRITRFRFLDLPPELRDLVYEHLLEDPYYPPRPSSPKPGGLRGLSWLVPGRKNAPWATETGERKSNWIFLVNKQIYAEYLDILCKKSRFTLTVSPSNYPKSLTTSPSTPTSPPSKTQKIWQIASKTLEQVRKCDIKLITTSSMLGVPDPRNMAPASWPLAKQVRQELSSVKNVRELNLHVRAIGDPLWNPLWVWYHASQSFKSMGSCSSPSFHEGEGKTTGPKLNRITFSLDTWSPGENYLERDRQGRWGWWCGEGHWVCADGEAGLTVREFCARLYAECRVCRPGSEGEVEDP
ncbi:hypothetical protein K469DRAFT_706250 [Zopfia rhizophila CBS 207.26]|uniref:F-box domain-containing protein n=1 Tax=Zopfia rhizophila CBS 207.26 TaxID=1314779 RepID=A0A6A6EU12_9PEZI|nr:hypothetical protein K469DRAFT_706250 [Zopfia rhizophila CBS 207.26]